MTYYLLTECTKHLLIRLSIYLDKVFENLKNRDPYTRERADFRCRRQQPKSTPECASSHIWATIHILWWVRASLWLNVDHQGQQIVLDECTKHLLIRLSIYLDKVFENLKNRDPYTRERADFRCRRQQHKSTPAVISHFYVVTRFRYYLESLIKWLIIETDYDGSEQALSWTVDPQGQQIELTECTKHLLIRLSIYLDGCWEQL